MSKPNPFDRLVDALTDWGNRIFFPVRSRIAWKRPGYHMPNESKERLFDGRARSLELELLKRYDLETVRQNSTIVHYRENLFTLHLLETAFNSLAFQLPEQLDLLDVGPKNWYYLRVLYPFLQRWRSHASRQLHVTGVELDPFRIHRDWYSHWDYAHYFMEGLPNCDYRVGDFLEWEGKHDLILLLFPFVTWLPLLHWGLPKHHYRPLQFLQHAVDCLKPGGIILIINQGPEEFAVQSDLIAQTDLRVIQSGPFESPFMDFALHRQRYFSLAQKATS